MKAKQHNKEEANDMSEKMQDNCECNGHCACGDDCTCETGMPNVLDAPPPAAADFEARYHEAQDRYQRTLAEFDNFRKRSIKEKAAQYDEGLRAAAENLLPVIDNFERAMAAQDEDAQADTFYQGIALIARQLLQTLEGLGITPILTQSGDEFDTHIHHAVAHIEDDSFGPNQVAEVLQKGYQHKDKVLRHCMVKVAN